MRLIESFEFSALKRFARAQTVSPEWVQPFLFPQKKNFKNGNNHNFNYEHDFPINIQIYEREN